MKTIETIKIFVENRDWNIDAINELYGFTKEEVERGLSNLEIAELLKLQAEHEYCKHSHLLDVEKVFVLVQGRVGREGYFDDSKPSTHEPYGCTPAHYEAEDSEDDGYHD